LAAFDDAEVKFEGKPAFVPFTSDMDTDPFELAAFDEEYLISEL